MSTANLKERIMNSLNSAERCEATQNKRRIPVVKAAIAAAAAFVILALLVYPTLQTSSSYAFAQTIDATRAIESIHLRMTPAPFNAASEIWAQFENGELVRLKMSFSNTPDGPKHVLWENDEAQVWFKKKNCISTFRDTETIQQYKKDYSSFDPRVENLYKQAEGNFTVDVKEPASPAEPIVVTVTVPDKPKTYTYTIDSNTKLLLRRDVYFGEEIRESIEYLDYNQVDPAVFAFDAPPDVMRVDFTKGVGIDQGALSDADIATKVVREFFDAIIAKDYAKASPLFSNMPPAKLEEIFGGMNIIRVISIGTPEPQEATRSLRVPCTLEREVNGKTETFEPDGPFVRQGDSLPGYWTISGGI